MTYVQDNEGGQTDDEYDQMKHDAPGISEPATHAHTAPGPSKIFAGISSGHQSRKEYDYVAIRTTLNDVLCELRYRNDIDVECDQLFRDMQRQ